MGVTPPHGYTAATGFLTGGPCTPLGGPWTVTRGFMENCSVFFFYKRSNSYLVSGENRIFFPILKKTSPENS